MSVARGDRLHQADLVTLNGVKADFYKNESALYRFAGGEHRLLVFVQGMETGSVWKSFARQLTIMRIDYGVVELQVFSTTPETLKGATNEEIMRDLKNQLAILGRTYREATGEEICHMHLIGHSYGAVLSLLFATEEKFLAEERISICGLHLLAPALRFQSLRLKMLHGVLRLSEVLAKLICTALPFRISVQNYVRKMKRSKHREHAEVLNAVWLYPWFPLRFVYQLLLAAEKAKGAIRKIRCRVWLYEARDDVLVSSIEHSHWRNFSRRGEYCFCESSGHFIPLDNDAAEVILAIVKAATRQT